MSESHTNDAVSKASESSFRNEEEVRAYLLEQARPDWLTLLACEGFTEHWVVFFLKRSAAIPKEAIQDIYENKRFRGHYPITLALVRCKSTPHSLALNLLPLLRRFDLFMTLKQPYLPNRVKVKIELMLIEAFPQCALGERLHLARLAPKGLVRQLRIMPDPPVVKALLSNYFFTYEDALFLANYSRAHPECLAELIHSPKWNHFKEVQISLLRNFRTPRSKIPALLGRINDFDMKRLLKEDRMPPHVKAQVRQRQQLKKGKT